MKHFNAPLLTIKLIVAIILMIGTQHVNAQTVYTLAQNTAVQIKVLGKSNANDMVVATTAMESQVNFKFNGQNLDDVTSLSFNLYAQNIQGHKSAVNKRAYKVLNATKNPNIRFKVKCATVTPINNNSYGVILGGELTVGGITQLKCMLLSATMNDDSTITLTGKTNIQLTNDNLRSVKFMEGPVMVENDLAIQFTFVYKKDLIQDTPIEAPHNRFQDYITKL